MSAVDMSPTVEVGSSTSSTATWQPSAYHRRRCDEAGIWRHDLDEMGRYVRPLSRTHG
ncbi:MAG: hypothetical protein PGN29_10405 [Gordonia paraffinivorans]